MFARRCADNGIVCVKFDFYGCGESDGGFSEIRYMDEVEQAKATYLWASGQPWCDRDDMFPARHSMGGAIVSSIISRLQPRGTVIQAPGSIVYYDISSRVHTVPDHYEELYDTGGLMMSSEFLSQVRKTDIVGQTEGYGKGVLIIHGKLNEKVPVYAVGPYPDLHGGRARLRIIKGANHQFASVGWENRIYELSINYIREKVGSTEKYLLED